MLCRNLDMGYISWEILRYVIAVFGALQPQRGQLRRVHFVDFVEDVVGTPGKLTGAGSRDKTLCLFISNVCATEKLIPTKRKTQFLGTRDLES